MILDKTQPIPNPR